jgi:hypothetical protein
VEEGNPVSGALAMAKAQSARAETSARFGADVPVKGFRKFTRPNGRDADDGRDTDHGDAKVPNASDIPNASDGSGG